MKQPMPRFGAGPSIDDCFALSEYWRECADNPVNNQETTLTCIAEAQHWADVAARLAELELATPFPTASTVADRREAFFRSGQKNVQEYFFPNAIRAPRH